MIDASPEAWWSAERISGGKGIVRYWGRRGITIYYGHPGRGERRTLSVMVYSGGGEKGSWSKGR